MSRQHGFIRGKAELKERYIETDVLCIGGGIQGLLAAPVGQFVLGFPFVFIFTAIAQFVAGNYTLRAVLVNRIRPVDKIGTRW
jgi:hypothetical protein